MSWEDITRQNEATRHWLPQLGFAIKTLEFPSSKYITSQETHRVSNIGVQRSLLSQIISK